MHETLTKNIENALKCKPLMQCITHVQYCHVLFAVHLTIIESLIPNTCDCYYIIGQQTIYGSTGYPFLQRQQSS